MNDVIGSPAYSLGIEDLKKGVKGLIMALAGAAVIYICKYLKELGVPIEADAINGYTLAFAALASSLVNIGWKFLTNTRAKVTPIQ